MRTIVAPIPAGGAEPKQLRAELRRRLGQGAVGHERVAAVRVTEAGVEVQCTDDVVPEAVTAAIAGHVPEATTELETELDEAREALDEALDRLDTLRDQLDAEQRRVDSITDLVEAVLVRLAKLEDDGEWSASVIRGLQAALSQRPARADNVGE